MVDVSQDRDGLPKDAWDMFLWTEGRIIFQGIKRGTGIAIISMMQAEEFVGKGSEAYFATININGSDMETDLDTILVVAEYTEVMHLP